MNEPGWAALADPEFEPLPDWLEALADGREGAGWVRTNWVRAKSQPGAWFDQAKADAVVRLWPQMFKLTSNRFAGHPFRLCWWQEIIVRFLVGWKIPVEEFDPATGRDAVFHVRLFRELMLWVPRKNGKSEFLAALALLFWALDGVKGGEGYLFARDEKQADLALVKMKEMVRLMPSGTAARFNIYGSSIYCPTLACSFQVLTGSEGGKHGKAPYVRFGDEMHEWRSTKIEDDLRGGCGVYLQPLGLKASTAGLKSNLVGVGLFEQTRDILDGSLDDPTVMAVIFAAGEDDDPFDEATWRKANPNLGVSITLRDMQIEAAKAQRSFTAEAKFRAYRLNQWVEDSTRWLKPEAWDKCTADAAAWRTRAEDMAGRRCWGGFDLARTGDVQALTWLFEPEPGSEVWPVLTRYWMAEGAIAAIEDKLRKARIESFVQMGALQALPGDVIDQRWLISAVKDGFERFDVQRLGLDAWDAGMVLTEMQHEGIDADQLLKVPMNVRSLGGPSQRLEDMVGATALDHGGDPVLRWMSRNVAIRYDENMNFMPAKKRSPESIDGIMSLVIALATQMAGEGEGPSVYEERGALSV